jgi:hypothetical protein
MLVVMVLEGYFGLCCLLPSAEWNVIMIMNRKFGRKQAYSVSRLSSNFQRRMMKTIKFRVRTVRFTSWDYNPQYKVYTNPSISSKYTQWRKGFLKKLAVMQSVKKFPTLMVHYCVHRALIQITRYIYYTSSHGTCIRSILRASSNLCLCLPSGLFPSGLPTKMLY